MKKRISLLLPSRARPKLVERFLRSVAAESTHPELIEVILRIDDDDVESCGIVFNELSLKIVVGPRQNMGVYNNDCLRHASGEIIIAVNDDIVIRTKGWDEKVRELDARFSDGVYLGYCNDLFKGNKLCTFPIMSGITCKLLAEPYPQIYRGAFIDTHLMDIFRRLEKRGYGRFAYADDIIFEHVHYRNNPGALDTTYTDRPRFADDLNFIDLVDARRLEADRLSAHIIGKTTEIVPFKPRARIAAPGPIAIVALCARKFLFDFDLSLRWRSYLFAWMVARYYFSSLFRIP